VTQEVPEVKVDLDVMGVLLKNRNEIWFEYVLPTVPTLKDKMKQTSLRFHLEKEEKKLGVNKLAIVNKEGFLPKIEGINRMNSKKTLMESDKKKDPIPPTD
jgi:hypothetical protein